MESQHVRRDIINPPMLHIDGYVVFIWERVAHVVDECILSEYAPSHLV
jgi:hypothetical protein